MRNSKLVLFAVTILFSGLIQNIPAQAKNIHAKYKDLSAPGEIVVKLRAPDVNKKIRQFDLIAVDLQTLLKTKSTPKVTLFKTSARFAVFKVSPAQTDSAISILNKDKRVAYAEPNFIYHAFETDPNDPSFAQQWGLKNKGQTDASGVSGKSGSDIRVSTVWNSGIWGDTKIKVAVIDTGIDYRHTDLQKNIWINNAEAQGTAGVDDDGNGFIDDLHGWNFAKNTNDPVDDHNHGSHCAGVIGANANNGSGVAGVNWNVTMVPIKFLDENGSGTLDAAVQSIQYATKLGVNIMSNSWGGGGFSQALLDSIAEARSKGILFIAAAGNASMDNDASASYPASYALDNVLSVAATNNRDQLADFSNYGKVTVHVAAPGVDILSTSKNNSYMTMSGTSMATPHVAGIAALMYANNPTFNYAKIKDILIRSSDPVRGLGKRVLSGGRVNAANAIFQTFPQVVVPDASLWRDFSFTLSSLHPYDNGKVVNYPIEIPGAKYIRIFFEYVDTEAIYDKVTVTDVAGEPIEVLSGSYANYVSDYLDGGKATVSISSDSSINKNGFKISKIQAIF